MNKFDRRRKYYLILDCETATLPYASNYQDGKIRTKIAIAKPLIYDIGWNVVDAKGNIYATEHFLISEIFSVPSVFNTAYYKEKRPLYIEMLKNGSIKLMDWKTVSAIFEEYLQVVESVGAYNSMFDFKKAIAFTELYINMLYSNNFEKWQNWQNSLIDDIANDVQYTGEKKEFEPTIFRYHSKEYKLFDLWGLACKYLLNNDKYRQTCIDNDWITASGKYFSTTAESVFRYINQQHDFEEAHTALDDATIETKIFSMITKASKNKWEIGIIYFPFRMLGTVDQFSPSPA